MVDRTPTGRSGTSVAKTPALEWIASGIGLALAVGTPGFIGREGTQRLQDEPPAIEVRVERIVSHAAGYTVEIRARNLHERTAAEVEIEGTLRDGDREIATSRMTLAYVPGRSERGGGLFFEVDPRAYSLQVRALGYEQP
jgi:uncharacterized protein (TIGR02588 family)